MDIFGVLQMYYNSLSPINLVWALLCHFIEIVEGVYSAWTHRRMRNTLQTTVQKTWIQALHKICTSEGLL